MAISPDDRLETWRTVELEPGRRDGWSATELRSMLDATEPGIERR
jgi:hypothetical protein